MTKDELLDKLEEIYIKAHENLNARFDGYAFFMNSSDFKTALGHDRQDEQYRGHPVHHLNSAPFDNIYFMKANYNDLFISEEELKAMY